MSRPLKIAFVAPNVLPLLGDEGRRSDFAGGAERQQILLAGALQRRGHDVSFVTLDSDGHGPEASVVAGFEVWRSHRPDAGWPVVRFVHPRWTSWMRALAAADADVYYQRCAGMLTGLVARFCRRRRRGFVFATAHRYDCSPRTVALANPRDRALYGYGIRRADVVITQTAEQRELLWRDFAIASTTIRSVQPVTTSTGAGAPRDAARFAAGPVLWLATLQEWKRPEWLLALARAFPETRFRMAGGPVPGSRQYAEAIVAEARGVANLEVLGHVPPGRIDALLDDARVLLSTSRAEGFPNTTLQAWARGVPVYAATDPDRCIASSGGGQVGETLEELAAALEAGLADPERLVREGRRGRAHLAAHHDLAGAARRFEQVLRWATEAPADVPRLFGAGPQRAADRAVDPRPPAAPARVPTVLAD